MQYQDFIENIKEHVRSQLDDSFRVDIHPVVKNNGTIYDGLIIIDPILNISPTIYLNPFYQRFLDGEPLESIYECILNSYHENLPHENFDISLFKDFEKAKPHIIFKLVNYKRNRRLLKEVPHVRLHDLALIYVVAMSDFSNEFATILIHNEHLSFWDIKPYDLYSIALENTPILLPYTFHTLEHLIEDYSDEFPSFIKDFPLSILTNHVKIHGASCMVYPGVLDEIANELNDDLVIIPSSIHEVLILPASEIIDSYSMQDFADMIKDTNDTQLASDEVLSDHAYLYRKEARQIVF